VLLCKQIDRLASSRLPTYTPNLLFNNISTTKKVKGRLLYYYPVDNVTTDDGKNLLRLSFLPFVLDLNLVDYRLDWLAQRLRLPHVLDQVCLLFILSPASFFLLLLLLFLDSSEMFIDDATGKEMPNPDPKGGLWIVDRHSMQFPFHFFPFSLSSLAFLTLVL
jgi:hypothetical protein